MTVDQISDARFSAIFEGQHVGELNPHPIVERVGQEEIQLEVGDVRFVDLEIDAKLVLYSITVRVFSFLLVLYWSEQLIQLKLRVEVIQTREIFLGPVFKSRRQ